MGKILNIFFFVLCLSLASCKVINSVSIDYMLPADICFPPEVKNVAIVNNTPQGEEKPLLKKPDERKKDAAVPVAVFDGYAKLTAEELANNVAEKNYFDQVIICDSALRAKDHVQRETQLSQDEVKELTQSLGVDMLLSLERVKLYFNGNVAYLSDSPVLAEVLDAKVSSMVRIYLPARPTALFGLNDRDSIYWTGSWNITDDVVKEASSFAATLPLKHILPTWKTVDRYYYASGSIEMRDAAVCVREDTWEDAFKLWGKTFKLKSDKMRMRAAYNIALYYEMKDQLENAKEWLEKAKSIAEKKLPKNEDGEVLESTQDYALILLYKADLDERVTNMQKLNLQMSRFKDDF